jgi:hypothetical protein
MANIQILTIITPSYEKVGREMIRRVKKFTGHEVKVIECPDSDGFWQKLNLDKHTVRRKTIWMDCDMWPIRHWNPEHLHLGSCIQGVHDSGVFNHHSFCHTDCKKGGLDWDRYLNTGLVFWDNSNPDHREMFKLARRIWKDNQKKRRFVDVTDQGCWNAAIKDLGLPLQFLPEQHNCYLFGIFHGQRPYIPRDIINLHGAGIPAKSKYSRLKMQASVLGQKMWPMHQEAVNWEFARQFALR